MARTRVRWGRVGWLAVAVAAAVTVAAGGAAAGSPAARDRWEPVRIHIVHPGDTLWSIAVRMTGPEGDPRPLVDAIAERNHVAGPILPGQPLVIPEG
jgi:hypothetical protein